MSSDTADGNTPAEGSDSGHLGVWATWRLTPTPARALLAGVFFNRLLGFLTIFLVAFLHDYKGFSTLQAGIGLGVYGAGAVVGTIYGGYLSDRISPRAATLISMGGSALLLIALVYLKIYALVLVAAILISLVSVIYRPAAQVMITELVPQSRLVMVMAMYRLALNLGATVAPIIGVAMFETSPPLLFWFEAAAALIYGVIALRYLPRKPKPTTAEAAQAGAASQEKAPKASYLDVLRDWRYVFFLAAVLLVMTVYTQYTSTLYFALKLAHQSIWWYGAVVTLNAVLVVALEVPITKFVQGWPLIVPAIGGYGLIAIGYALYGISLIPVVLIIGTLIWTLNEIIGAPTTFSYPGMVAPTHLRGRYFGSMQSMVGLGTVIGPIVGIAVFNSVHQNVWWYAAGVALLSMVCALIGMRLPKKEAEPTAAAAAAEAAAAETPIEPTVAETAADQARAAEAAAEAEVAAEAETTS
ncbi:MAG TPA: MFS transporter [Streptosporangiaceae bacterium]|nr:MFS transporter [Streptosporangiaceae bacterium]